MAISTEEVNRIAVLSRLSFSEEEKQKLMHELSAILEFVDKLNEIQGQIETAGLEDPSAINLMRDDVVKRAPDPEIFLQQAPAIQDGFVKVKSILE